MINASQLDSGNSPPYLPDINPPVYFALPKLKLELKGSRFENVEDIRKSVTDQLMIISIEALKHFRKSIEDLKTRCLHYNEVGETTLNNVSVKNIFFYMTLFLFFHSENFWDGLCIYCIEELFLHYYLVDLRTPASENHATTYHIAGGG